MTPRTRTLGILVVSSLVLGPACRERTAPTTDPSSPDASRIERGPGLGVDPSKSSDAPAPFDPLGIEPAAYQPPAPIDAESITVDSEQLHRAPARYAGVVGRLTIRDWRRHENLVYEGNNLEVRGERAGDAGPYIATGRETALRWREWASGVRGVFVLRDSLFSQQDHPVEQHGFAPMFGPNWITVIADRASRGESLTLPELPEIEDHAAWAKLVEPEAMFGDLPHSDSILRHGSADVSGLDDGDPSLVRARNARRTLTLVMRDARAMRAAMQHGPQAVATLGAERIAHLDAVYFGEDLRRASIIPILVEHPNAKEFGEGKGMVPEGMEVDAELVRMVTRTVYRRRLEDGDLAIERYDLSEQGDRARAVRLLEDLVPEGAAGEPKTRVWLWVNGKLDPKRKLRGEPADAYIPGFKEELERAKIDMSRVVLLSKPTVFVRGKGAKKKLDEAVGRYEALGMPVSVSTPAPALVDLVARVEQ